MIRHSIIFLTGLFLSIAVWAQPKIGFTNLNGFPSVVSNGAVYNVSGYIKNTGQDSMHTGVNIMMRVNNGPSIPIQNNFSFNSPLAPGDSIFWSKGNHSFPGGQFAPGNNDVIIWPTRMIGPPDSSEIDSLLKQMFFAYNAAFILCDHPIPALTNGADLEVKYDLDVCAENAGRKKNKNDIALYMQVGSMSPKIVATTSEEIIPGEVFQLFTAGFKVLNYVDLSAVSAEDLIGQEVTFWVEELEEDNAVDDVHYPIVRKQNPSNGTLQTILFPNPVQLEMQLRFDDDIEPSDIVSIQIYTITGQLLYQASNPVATIDMAGFRSGHYLLVIQSSSGRTVRHFVKE